MEKIGNSSPFVLSPLLIRGFLFSQRAFFVARPSSLRFPKNSLRFADHLAALYANLFSCFLW
jgi:hypothetical protein